MPTFVVLFETRGARGVVDEFDSPSNTEGAERCRAAEDILEVVPVTLVAVNYFFGKPLVVFMGSVEVIRCTDCQIE
ncbi:hypothetical protein HETIRDRAFT_408733 [Heterobasidion irregulare TC 32-1]|uniref:Uncharacterized protein n=1 Tax=Heterobasidion irregulare (strain TC 32-1) TaxID=747525 RepID=W4KGA4_HETIT|nr:uncharacterized protein HETIRDRAFT_408733 [Heterobasidion irregulare TC 32-1]ETW84888.1 hypothetical protein HETIRDRAFT_408733 [Heterobasidion irregulare TC 32-1]